MRELVTSITLAVVVLLACLSQVVGAPGHGGAGWHHAAVAAGLTLTAAVVAVLAAGAAWRILVAGAGHRRLVRQLRAATRPATIAGHRVRVGALGEVGFVAGLLRPVTFLDPHEAARLTGSQLEAVLAHEAAHGTRRDPLRQLLIATLALPLLDRTAGGRRWLATAAARREIAADRAALAAGVTRADLAGALLASGGAGRAEVAAFGPATDLRLRALLTGDPPPRAPFPGRAPLTVGSVAVVVAIGCGGLLHGALIAAVGG